MALLHSLLLKITTRLKSHEIRIRRRRAFGAWLTRHATLLRIILFFIGYAWMIVIPSPRLGRGIYIDENALQPAQANTYWGWGDVRNADRYLEQLEYLRDANATSEHRAQFLKNEFTKLGISASIQAYTYTLGTNVLNGNNAYAVFSSPRASGTEAIVISASWISRIDEGNGTLNLRGISTLLALAAFLKRYSLWAKDIVFVVSDGYLDGMHAWLNAYHGETQSNLLAEPLYLSSGVVWTALNIDYPGHSFSHLGIFYAEGCNGRLPNQDLQNSIYWIARSSGVPVTVYDHIDTPVSSLSFNWLPDALQKEVRIYTQHARNILRHVKYQARGLPSGVHGLYHQYRIDAVTIFGIPATGPHGFHSIGRVAESTLRTMNNLLERLHASFFFFILAAPERFLKIGHYLPSALVISAATMFGGLKAWTDAGWASEIQSTKTYDKGISHQRKHRPILGVITLMASMHTVGLILFWAVMSSWYMNNSHMSFLLFATTTALVLLIAGLYRSHYGSDLYSHSQILKSFNLSLASAIISITTILNFSLAAILAILLGIPLSICIPSSPTASLPTRVLRYIPYALLGVGWLLFPSKQVEQALWHWEVLSVWFVPFVCIVYTPIVLQAGLVGLI
ncbi:hypothetical protein AMATHDRAFT_135962 [Amanita thiersii Skay4041]|uniref:Gaa1-domain-containing protein n=1 Tax=Amanita thiersii Skay4041 TaxID=703135 RepID=A0A2A9NZS9_9AGAR|nr:hypothetical protein AMATHDRAFT_135962 [Amanita thiersii Skay4041]